MGKRSVRLNTARDVRKYLAKLVNEMRREEVSVERGKALGYICKLLLESLKTSDLEARIEALEKESNSQEKGGL